MKKTTWKSELPAVIVILATLVILMVGTIIIAWNMNHSEKVEEALAKPPMPTIVKVEQTLEGV